MKLAWCCLAVALVASAPFAACAAAESAPAAAPSPAPPPAQMVPPYAYGPFFGGDDPWMELRMMQDRINRIMEESFGRVAPRAPMPWGMPALDFSPDIDLTETDAAYVVVCDLPGMEKDKIEVTFKDGELIIRGSRAAAREEGGEPGWYVRERSSGAFERIIAIGEGVKEDVITAEYTNGVLTVTVPKTESAAKPGKKILVL